MTMADPRAPTVTPTATPTAADLAAWEAVCDLARRVGPDRAAAAALFASGHPLWPHVLLAAARGAGVDDTVAVLRLAPGELADVVNVALPTPSPLPADEATVFPADDDDDPDPAPGPFAARHRLVLLRELPEPTAAALAICVPGVAPGGHEQDQTPDTRHDTAEVLKISVDDVDAVLDHAAGQHISRPLG
jgi:hypothetical protein